MDIKNIYQDSRWFASYFDSNEAQAKALVLCQIKKITQLKELIGAITAEIELAENPKEYSAETVLQSIKAMIYTNPQVEHTEGHFKWVG